MENQLNSKLILENATKEESWLHIFPDFGRADFVGFSIFYQTEPISFWEEGDIENEYFHLDKFNLGCLIDYLKRIHKDMD